MPSMIIALSHNFTFSNAPLSLLLKTCSSHIFTSSSYPLDVAMCPSNADLSFFFFFNRDIPLAISSGLAGGKEGTRLRDWTELEVSNLLAMQMPKVRSLGPKDSPAEGHGKPLQYSCLENPMYKRTWRATAHGIAKSRTLLKWLCMHASRKAVNSSKLHKPLPTPHLTALSTNLRL